MWANEDGATPLGIKNLDGNVSEWSYGWYDWGNDFYSVDERIDPVGSACTGAEGDKRIRGASFADGPMLLPSMERRRVEYVVRAPTHGFRCARTVTDEGGLCAPGVPEVPDRCRPAADPEVACSAPAFADPRPGDRQECGGDPPWNPPTCSDPRDDYCPGEQDVACPAYLLRRLEPDGTAALDFVPRALLDALGVDPDDLGVGTLEGSLDGLLRTSLAPLGGDALVVLELPDSVGSVDGRPTGRFGPGYLTQEGGLSFAGLRDGQACVPAALGTMEYRSSRGSLDVRSLCGLTPVELYLPEAARTIRLTGVFMEAERTAAGLDGSMLAVANDFAMERWTNGSPPIPLHAAGESVGLPRVSLCELYDVVGCDQKPPGCPDAQLEPCPDDPGCMGFIFPFRAGFVPAQRAAIPGLNACRED